MVGEFTGGKKGDRIGGKSKSEVFRRMAKDEKNRAL